MLYLLYGDDALTSEQKLQAIKEKFLIKDLAGSGLSVFPARNALHGNADGGYESVINTIGTPNLLAPKRLIIIKEFICSGAESLQGEILDFLKKEKFLKDDQDVVVIFWENKKVKKSSKLFKFLEKNGKIQNFEKPSGIKLNQWVEKRFQKVDPKAQISSGALEKLIFYTSGDLFSLSQEIEKLVNYSGGPARNAMQSVAGGKTINEEDVDLLVQADFDNNIFQTIDAIGNRNKKEALKFLHQHLKRGDDPFYIFSMLVYQFRNLLKIADLKDNYGMSEQEIAQSTKIHPFVVKKSLAQIKNFPFATLKKIYQKLSIFDVKIKTGQLDIKLALDKFIVEI